MRSIKVILGLAVMGAGAMVANWLLMPDESSRLREINQRLEREWKELQAIVERLGTERRVADVHVVEQRTDERGRVVETLIQFVEYDGDGRALPAKNFCVPGRTLYFDALVIKFREEFVAAGDPLRGKSVALFRRIFSEVQAPKDGQLIDPDGIVPEAYRVSRASIGGDDDVPAATDESPSAFERRLWQRFWSYASDSALASREGVRVAQGEAVYAPMTANDQWTLTLEADGGLNLTRVAPKAPAENATN